MNKLHAPELTEYRGLDGLRRLQSDWRRLTERDDRYWIQYGFVEESLRYSVRNPDSVVFYAQRTSDGTIAAIVPMEPVTLIVRRARFRALQLFGSTFDDVSCQASAVDFPAESPDIAAATVRDILRSWKWRWRGPSIAFFGRVAIGSLAYTTAEQLQKANTSRLTFGGWKWLDVDRPYEALEAELSGKFKIALRSAHRKLSTVGAVEFGTTPREAPEFDSAFDEFLRLEASGWKGDVGTRSSLLVNPVQNQRKFLEAIARGHETGAEVQWLRLNGEAVACQLWVRFKQSRVAFKVAYDERFARFQPGHLLISHVLRTSCADSSLKYVDFVSDAAWLDTWRAELSVHHHLYVPIRQLSGLFLSVLLRLPTASQALATLRARFS